jgi:hypothetical protein
MSVRGITKEVLVSFLEKEQVEGSLGLFTDEEIHLPGGLASYIPICTTSSSDPQMIILVHSKKGPELVGHAIEAGNALDFQL